MYISSQKLKSGYGKNQDEASRIYGPCLICKKEIINAGIREVRMREEGVGDKTFTLEDLKKLLREEEEKLRRDYRQSK